MDKIKFLMELFVLILIVEFTYCDSQCDCSSLMDEQAFIRSKMTQMELDNFKIKSRLRRLEVTQRQSTRPNVQKTSEYSNRQPTPADAREEDVRDKARMDSLEAKISGVESLLKISVVNDTDVQQRSVQSEVLDEIETNLSSISEQMKDVTEKNDANKVVLGNVVRKTLFAEKRRRINFESIVKSSVEDIKASFDEFKMNSENLVRNHSNTFKERLEQSAEIVNEVVATINEEIQSMNVSLYDVMEDLSETKTGLSNLEDETINDQKDGAWSSWQSWGSCSAFCGGGIQSRLRTCSNPKPSLLGRYCDGTPLQMRICNRKQCAEYNVAFTAYSLDIEPSTYSTLVFRNTHINNGNGYDTRTGKFTCKIPGVYHFSVTLTKDDKKLSYTDPFLRINGKNRLDLYWESYNDDKLMVESTQLTHSGTFHLNKGDVVDVHGIPNHFYSFIFADKTCTFTGFLITPD